MKKKNKTKKKMKEKYLLNIDHLSVISQNFFKCKIINKNSIYRSGKTEIPQMVSGNLLFSTDILIHCNFL